MSILQIYRIANDSPILYTGSTGVMPMMTYEPFWRMMNERRISTYSLEVDYGFNKAFIHRLKHNKNMNLSYIDFICDVFSCSVEEVVMHVCDEKNADEKYFLKMRDG